MPITKKLYYCPLCMSNQYIETNHYGSTYSGCKNCKSVDMYCAEKEAIENREKRPFVLSTIHSYYFDISKLKENKKYEELMKSIKVEKWETFPNSHKQTALTQNLDGLKIKFYTDFLSDNQWMTNVGRLFDFLEWEFPNKSIKSGYYIELTPELLQLRENNHICGYCGVILPINEVCRKSKNCVKYGMKKILTRIVDEKN